MTNVILNGKETEVAPGEKILGFLQARKVGTKNLILEWNGKILTEKDPLATFELKDGDTINLFSMVGGG